MSNQIKTIIVDDEAPARSELRFLLEKFPVIQILGEASGGEEALKMCADLEPDLVFLDIQMRDMDGLKVTRELMKNDKFPLIVFATAYDRYAIKAFEVNAVDYLLKPFSEERIAKTVERVQKQVAEPNITELLNRVNQLLLSFEGRLADNGVIPVDELDRAKITVSSPKPAGEAAGESNTISEPSGSELGLGRNDRHRKLSKLIGEKRGKMILLEPEELVLATVEDRNTLLKTRNEVYQSRYKLHELEEKFADRHYFRTHRSYLVNLNQIKEVIPWFNNTYKLVMNDQEETEVPVSRTFVKDLKEALGL
ncbi:LytR/AlgR family response regulator transcription factor [Calderihabitans maritimus]|uniref:Stage 0 sporulation protein A homolog n=1 Tax=Calderihabitans maritimus TaxID=1246530 RepID=A0A1Z5HQY9_9FIRM|nr:LytTR family DNA-binding domain-containing protein [Calderihabitans maritimus]GAW91690.1 transcriptional regulator, lytr/algr family [Calderihabitans maritimus]